MRSIAKVLLEQGFHVTGSDVAETDAISALRELGAIVHIGHKAEHLDGAEMVVVSTAILADNPESAAAQARGIPVVHRSEVWAHLLNNGRGIAVAGTHGKTTVTSLISWVLHHAGHDPTFLIGGEIPGLGAARYGKGPIVVAEADESDGSFVRYRPWCSVVTSIEADHMEFYEGDFERLVDAYRRFLGNTLPEGLAVICYDDERIRNHLPELGCRRITYGFHPEAEWRATNVRLSGFQSTFQVERNGQPVGEARLSIPGRHNVQNALAVIAVCTEVGVDFAQITEHLPTFRGTRRRFECVGEHNDVLVIDDYAHHPSEIRATLQAARRGWPDRRLIAVFQPHRYTRTHALFHEFVTAFEDADTAIITEIYSPPPEKPIPGVSGERLAHEIQAALPQVHVTYMRDVMSVPDRLVEHIRPGDIVVTMGAGDVWRVAKALAERLQSG